MTREEALALVYGNLQAAIDLILHLVATVERLTARVEELERKVALLPRDSSNSLKPPSSDGPGAKLRPRRAKKSRKRNPGGQPGHKGTNRDLIPVEDVDHVIPVFPEACEHCGTLLNQDPEQATDKYWRHQVIDIPESKPEVTKYQLRCVRCSCGTENWPKIPQAVPAGFGPRIAASRGAKVLREIQGNEYKGTLCSDMYSAYNAYHKRTRQLRWAHLIRGIKGIKHGYRSPDAVKFSTWMLWETCRMFALWHAFKRGHVTGRPLSTNPSQYEAG